MDVKTNVKMMEKKDKENLERLQALRRKASKDRKDSYTVRIERDVFGIER